MSTTTRQKKKVIQAVTLDAAEQAFAGYNQCTSQLQVLEGQMNQELTAIKEKYDTRITKLQEEKEVHFEVMQTFAEENPDSFTKKKSLDFVHGTIGFRTGTPKLQCRKGFKWPGVLELVKTALPNFIRVKEDLNKEALLAARNEVDLKAVGLEAVQDETFYVEPALQQVSAN